jgi:chromosome segregation ATPase
VKVDYGEGFFGIKMVGNTRGKLRRVQWTQLYKDRSFNTLKGMERGGRVRTSGRMQEIAKEEAEAKLGEELRKTKRELQKAQKKHKEKEKEAENRLKRQEREARKAGKDQLVGHKRQMEEMFEESKQDMQTFRDEKDSTQRETRICIREFRQAVSSLQDQVGREQEEQANLEKQLVREQKKRTTLESSVDTWKEKHAGLDDMICEKEERLRDLKTELAEKSRKIITLERRGEREEMQNKTAVELLVQQRDALGNDLTTSNIEVQFWAEQTAEVYFIPTLHPCTLSNPHTNPNPNS